MQLIWPGNPEAGHQTLAALLGPLTECPAGPLNAPLHAPGNVDHAQEEANVLGAHSLHDPVKEGHLHHCFSLTCVPEQIWGDSLVVGQTLAQRHGDRLADLPADAHAVLEPDKSAGQSRSKQVNF